MQNETSLYQKVSELLSRGQWRDRRHLQTAVNLIVGLIFSGSIRIPSWLPFAQTGARFAQSVQRRFSRWLYNERIQVAKLYAPLIKEALQEWGEATLYLALDTTMLWNQYCLICLSVVYRGRAIPVVWQVIEHPSAQVAFTRYQPVLEAAIPLLPDYLRKIVLLADRGFADVALMRWCRQVGWHFRLRIKSNFQVHRPHRPSIAVRDLLPRTAGQAVFYHYVQLTAQHYGPVHLAITQPPDEEQPWYIVSDELSGLQTVQEYAGRFDIEEQFLDNKSNGLQLEDSRLRHAEALERLFFGIAVTTLFLVAQGTEVVEQQRRREVDPHWFRGSSYFKIGWLWIKQALLKGENLISRCRLIGGPDPDPPKASLPQAQAAEKRWSEYQCVTISCAI